MLQWPIITHSPCFEFIQLAILVIGSIARCDRLVNTIHSKLNGDARHWWITHCIDNELNIFGHFVVRLTEHVLRRLLLFVLSVIHRVFLHFPFSELRHFQMNELRFLSSVNWTSAFIEYCNCSLVFLASAVNNNIQLLYIQCSLVRSSLSLPLNCVDYAMVIINSLHILPPRTHWFMQFILIC